eukprot:SM000118S25576  [mRNA]  locus=s118:119155:121541:+ [translate_table: standard]
MVAKGASSGGGGGRCPAPAQDREAFLRGLHSSFAARGAELRTPKFYGVEVDLFKLWNVVSDLGGWEQVTQKKLWRVVGDNFDPPKSCTTVSWSFRGFYEKSLLDYERETVASTAAATSGRPEGAQVLGSLLPPSFPPLWRSPPVTMFLRLARLQAKGGGGGKRRAVGLRDGLQSPSPGGGRKAGGGKRAKKEEEDGDDGGEQCSRVEEPAPLAHSEALPNGLANGGRPPPLPAAVGSSDGDSQPGRLNQPGRAAMPPLPAVAAAAAAATNGGGLQEGAALVSDEAGAADWVKINVRKTPECFEIYALVPGLLREEVRVECEVGGRLVIAGEPEHPNNPWGVTAFRKVILLPCPIDAQATSAVVTLHGQLYVRAPITGVQTTKPPPPPPPAGNSEPLPSSASSLVPTAPELPPPPPQPHSPAATAIADTG